MASCCLRIVLVANDADHKDHIRFENTDSQRFLPQLDGIEFVDGVVVFVDVAVVVVVSASDVVRVGFVDFAVDYIVYFVLGVDDSDADGFPVVGNHAVVLENGDADVAACVDIVDF